MDPRSELTPNILVITVNANACHHPLKDKDFQIN